MTRVRRRCARRGVANAVEVALETGLDVPRTRRLLSAALEVAWLDDKPSWVALTRPDPAARAALSLAKMLSLSGQLTLAEVSDGLRGAARPIVLPHHVLIGVCESIPWLAVDSGRGLISARTDLDPVKELSNIEWGLFEIFGRHGPVLSFIEAVTRCELAGLTRSSVGRCLRQSPIFTTVARSRYRLQAAEPG
jgi:hypothetical protein